MTCQGMTGIAETVTKMTEHMKFTEDKIIMDRNWLIWNAFGKDDIDRENKVTDEEWRTFIAEYDHVFLEIEDWQHNAFDEYCEKIGKEDET